jgi:16S rRNA (guanine1207-N2)-methyltransferase
MTSREPSQYFSEQPSGTEVRHTITARLWGRELTLLTASGVFAADGLDRGTAVLLRASPFQSEARGSWTWVAGMAP